jgi:hypothetical protein
MSKQRVAALTDIGGLLSRYEEFVLVEKFQDFLTKHAL